MASTESSSYDGLAGAGTLRVGLIADTHIPRDAKILPPHVKEAFRDVNLILHAGDIYLPEILDELETIAPVLAARGNGDYDFPEDNRMGEVQVFNVAGLDIGLTHAINYPGSTQFPCDRDIVRQCGRPVDVIVFGDTHIAMVEKYNSTLLVNPGSPTLPNGRFELGTVGILEITGHKARAYIVQLDQLPIPFEREMVYYRGAGA